MANPSKYMHLTRDLEVLLKNKYDKYLGLLEYEVKSCAKAKIQEDRGGLIPSIHRNFRPSGSPYSGGSVSIDAPYAKFVNDGRGPVEVKNKKSLSNFNGRPEPFRGHSPFGYGGKAHPFIVTHADAFEGHHFVEEAMQNVADAIERGE